MLAWADGHLQRLKTSVEDFRLPEAYDLVCKREDVTGDQVVRARVLRRTPDDWAFMIGDALHNMRVPLDYLAFAIADQHAPAFAAAKPRQIAFPICEDVSDWPSFEGKLRQWASDQAILAFKGLQPYHGRHAPKREPLLVLDKLENPHKHRRLLAAGSAITRTRLRILDDPTGPVSIQLISGRSGPFEDGTEMLRFRIMGSAQPEAKMQFNVAFGVAFTEQGPASGAEVIETLERIRDHIRDDIFPELEPFL